MIKNLLIATVLVFSGSAFAETSTYQVVGKQHYRGENLIRLKAFVNKRLRAQGENPENYQMTGLTAKMKSKRGHGKATLIIGQDQQTKRVDKIGGDALFLVEAPWAYHNIRFDISHSPGLSDERWQLRLNGNIKVRGIQVHVASRSKRIRIPMGGEMFQGQSTIYLKQELKALGYRVKGKKLRKVVLVAKSRRGRGKAELMVGGEFYRQKNVGLSQSGFGFENNRPASYNRIKWKPNGPTRGAWQIHMRGRIKVKAVIVELK